MNEKEGLVMIDEFFTNEILSESLMTKNEINVCKAIISTMSYSTIKKDGYPNLGVFQSAYHIVREADLLSAYDLDRCLIFTMEHSKSNNSLHDIFAEASTLFHSRILAYIEKDLFVHEFAKKEAYRLHNDSLVQLETWLSLIHLKHGQSEKK